MRRKTKHDYSIFSKDELKSFLEKYESNFIYIDSPFDIMIGQKMDAVMKKIDQNIKNGKRLNDEYECTKDGLNYLVDSKKNNDAWQRLDKEYDRLSRLRFGD